VLPDKRPDVTTLYYDIEKLLDDDNPDDNTWNAVYHNDVKPLSRLEKESKYSSTFLPSA